MSEKLEQFQKYLNKIEQYRQIETQMAWDMQTQTPKKGYDYKIDAITYFSGELPRLRKPVRCMRKCRRQRSTTR